MVVFFQNFLRDLLKEAKKDHDVSEDKLIEYTDTMVSYDQGSQKFSAFSHKKGIGLPIVFRTPDWNCFSTSNNAFSFLDLGYLLRVAELQTEMKINLLKMSNSFYH